MMYKYILLVILFSLTGTISAGKWSRTGDVNEETRGPEGALLTNGKYITIGGYQQSTYEVFDPATGTWTLGSLPTTDDTGHTIGMLLPNGKVLYTTVPGTCYLYNTFTNSWSVSAVNIPWKLRCCATLLKDGKVLLQYSSTGASQIYDCWADALTPTGSTNTQHVAGTEVLLPDGRVLLIAGGSAWWVNTTKCEIYDPGSGTWSVTGDLITPQNSHVSVLLPSGRVLVAGGYLVNGQCEIYNPGTGTWSFTGSLGFFPRSVATMALLPSGKALIAGGSDASLNATQQCELYDYNTSAWSFTDNMAFPRCHFSSVILPTGKVLAVSAPYSDYINSDSPECEIYDPSEPYWEVKSPLHQERGAHTATPLPIIHTQVCSTNILIAGGENSSGYLKNCELYNYDLDLIANTGALNIGRSHHTAVLLLSGRVFAAGGKNSTGPLNSCELYNVNTENWSFTGSMSEARFGHTATLLKDGKVLVTGGQGSSGYLSSCEVYDVGTWSSTASMSIPRTHYTAVMLLDGRVLVIGGENSSGVLNSCEIFNGTTWSATGNLSTGRCFHTAVLLQSGKVLVIGGKGSTGNALTSCAIYDPTTGSWSAGPNLTNARYMHNSTLIYSGLVLVTGGYNGTNDVSVSEVYDPAITTPPEWKNASPLNTPRHYGTCTLVPTSKPYVIAIGGQSSGSWINSIERHDVGLGYQSAWQSTITNYQRLTPVSDSMHIEGTLFRGISEADGGNHVHIVSNDHPIISFVRVGGGNWQDNGGGAMLYMPMSSSWSEIHTDVHPPDSAPQGYYRLWAIVNGIPCKWYEECVEVDESSAEVYPRLIECKVYPNPSPGTIYIKFTSPSPVTAELSIYDCSGRLVRSRKSEIRNQKSEVIRLEGLKSGIYFYRIKSQDSEIRGKFTIIR